MSFKQLDQFIEANVQPKLSASNNRRRLNSEMLSASVNKTIDSNFSITCGVSITGLITLTALLPLLEKDFNP